MVKQVFLEHITPALDVGHQRGLEWGHVNFEPGLEDLCVGKQLDLFTESLVMVNLFCEVLKLWNLLLDCPFIHLKLFKLFRGQLQESHRNCILRMIMPTKSKLILFISLNITKSCQN